MGREVRKVKKGRAHVKDERTITTTRKMASVEPRFYIERHNPRYGDTIYFDIRDRTKDATKDRSSPIWIFAERKLADAFAAEMNRDPKLVPGVKVRITVGETLGGSRADELHRIYGQARYGAGDEGVLAHPHPNQLPDACKGWWYVAVAPKEPVEPRFEGDKETEVLYVGCWPGSFEVIS